MKHEALTKNFMLENEFIKNFLDFIYNNNDKCVLWPKVNYCYLYRHISKVYIKKIICAQSGNFVKK